MSKSFYIIYFAPSYAELYYCALRETADFVIEIKYSYLWET